MRLDVLLTTDIGTQRLWNAHAAICLLMRFQQGDQDARRGDGCVVERVHELDLAILVTVTDIRPFEPANHGSTSRSASRGSVPR